LSGVIGYGSTYIPNEGIFADGLIGASSIFATVISMHVRSLQSATSGADALHISQ
jgi:hypothetical protein